MSENETTARPADDHAGKGGSYVLDPATGKRTLVERTDWTPETSAAPAADKPAKPGK